MSGLVSGITKIFSAIGGGVARLGSAVRGVGASLFTAGVANGASVAGQGGLFGSGGVLASMFNGVGQILGLGGAGASTVAAGATPAVDAITTSGLGQAVADTASGYGSDVWSKAMTSGLQAANTPTGLAVAGASSATEPSGGGLLGGLGKFLGSEGGAALIGGIGESIGKEREYTLLEQMREKDRQFLRDKEQRITDSYNVPISAFAGSEGKTGAWKYNPNTGQIEKA